MTGSIFDKLTATVANLRAIAARIHCPDSEGGKYAAQVKKDLLTEADRLEMELKPTPPLVFPGTQQAQQVSVQAGNK